MNTTLILIGVACIIGAIIGGGVKLVQIELNPVASIWRQLLLGLFGIILVGSGLIAGNSLSRSDPTILASESVPNSASRPQPHSQGSIDRDQTARPGTAGVPPDGPAGEASGYILAKSQYERLTDTDLSALSAPQLRLARNEIYARHGRRFQSADLTRYFSQKSWYSPTLDDVDLSPVEKANVAFIQSHESNSG